MEEKYKGIKKQQKAIGKLQTTRFWRDVWNLSTQKKGKRFIQCREFDKNFQTHQIIFWPFPGWLLLSSKK